MTLDRALSLAGLVLTFVVVPLGGLTLRWLFATRPARRLLGLQRHTRIEVVTTTSATAPQGPGEADALLTAIGELRGIAVASRTMAKHYRKKKISYFMSDEYSVRPEGDLLLLGGPLKNQYSRGFLDRFNFDHPETKIELDALDRVVRIGPIDLGEFDQHYTPERVPRRDLGIVLLSSWTYDSPQRVILCAGLTTYGTEAAARFLFEEVLKKTKQASRLRRAMRHAPSIAVVVADIVGRQVIQTRLYEDCLWSFDHGSFRRYSANSFEPANHKRPEGSSSGA